MFVCCLFVVTTLRYIPLSHKARSPRGPTAGDLREALACFVCIWPRPTGSPGPNPGTFDRDWSRPHTTKFARALRLILVTQGGGQGFSMAISHSDEAKAPLHKAALASWLTRHHLTASHSVYVHRDKSVLLVYFGCDDVIAQELLLWLICGLRNFL